MSAPAPVRPRLLKRPVSHAQREAARRNGRLSRGPVSAQGKAHSSANARIHGLFAKVHILSSDDRARYRAKCDAYLADYSPQTAAETRALAALALMHTRLQTLAAFETLLWNDALRHAPRGPHRIAHAFESLAECRLFQALGRIESDCLRRAREAARAFLPGFARDMGPERTQELADSAVNQPTASEPLFFAAPAQAVGFDTDRPEHPDVVRRNPRAGGGRNATTRPAITTRRCSYRRTRVDCFSIAAFGPADPKRHT